jgi:hypothetical protein
LADCLDIPFNGNAEKATEERISKGRKRGEEGGKGTFWRGYVILGKIRQSVKAMSEFLKDVP